MKILTSRDESKIRSKDLITILVIRVGYVIRSGTFLAGKIQLIRRCLGSFLLLNLSAPEKAPQVGINVIHCIQSILEALFSISSFSI